MGKLAEIVQQERLEAIKPKFKRVGPHAEGDPIFKSDAFSGFSDFMSNEPPPEVDEFQQQNEKMMSIFTIMKVLMKMMD